MSERMSSPGSSSEHAGTAGTMSPEPAATRPSQRSAGQPPTRGDDAMAADRSTFAPALALLPDPLKADVQRLYRVLRTLDDLVDEDDPRAAQRVGAVERWAHAPQADRPHAGALEANHAQADDPETNAPQPDTPETRALTELARRYPLPRESLLEFCQAMRHDIARASVEDDADFTRYCQRAGGSVGVVLANILGTAPGADPRETQARGREAQTRMAALGRAMQITNILRDIDEDLTHGRVYISGAAIERFGFPEPGAREELLRDHIARAEELYVQGAGAIGLLRGGRQAMALAASLYREILRQLERDGFGRTPGRAVVPAWRIRQLTARHRIDQPQRL